MAAVERLLRLYESMRLIRSFEERVSVDFRDGRIPGIVHLSIGQEAVAAAVSINLRDDDYILTTHRGHGHVLAKSDRPEELMAEIWGKSTGVCRGKGGSMHIAHVASGALGANSIVGAGQPFAAGVALAIRQRGTDQVVVSYLGDGAITTGGFHEGAEMASIFSLPILYVGENNLYSETTGVRFHLGGQSMLDRVSGYGFRVGHCDGMDAEAVDEAAAELVAWVRTNQRPAFLECQTYRYHGHFEGDPQRYRTSEEVTHWRERDPLTRAERRLQEQGVDSTDLRAIDSRANQRVAAAAEFAMTSPFPQPAQTLEGVYAV